MSAYHRRQSRVHAAFLRSVTSLSEASAEQNDRIGAQRAAESVLLVAGDVRPG
jgi:hypothetical protein